MVPRATNKNRIEALLMLTAEADTGDGTLNELLSLIHLELNVLNSHYSPNAAIPNESFIGAVSNLSSIAIEIEAYDFESKKDIICELTQLLELLG